MLDPAQARRVVDSVADSLGMASLDFREAPYGTTHSVYLSPALVLRLRSRIGPLRREAAWLGRFEHALIPRVLWTKRLGNVGVAAVQRMPGDPLPQIWPRFTMAAKERVIAECVAMLEAFRAQRVRMAYSVATGRHYRTAHDAMQSGLDADLAHLRQDPIAGPVAAALARTVRRGRVVFAEAGDPYLFHGDLIVQNLISDGRRLTGIVDWERSGASAVPVDLFRLRYYHECAAAYAGVEPNGATEVEFLDMLLAAVWKTGLISDRLRFLQQYRVARSRYRLRAMAWAAAAGSRGADILITSGLAPAA